MKWPMLTPTRNETKLTEWHTIYDSELIGLIIIIYCLFFQIWSLNLHFAMTISQNQLGQKATITDEASPYS